MQKKIIFRHSEYRTLPKYRACFQHYTVVIGEKAFNFILENDFKNEPFLKFGTHYLSDDLRNEFYNLLDHLQVGIEIDPAPFMEKVLSKYQLSER